MEWINFIEAPFFAFAARILSPWWIPPIRAVSRLAYGPARGMFTILYIGL
jgi:hypothetical protein